MALPPSRNVYPFGRGLRDAIGTGHAARAADILDDDLLAEHFREALRHDTADRVDRPARRVRHDHGDRARRPVLRKDDDRGRGQQKRRQDCAHAFQSFTTTSLSVPDSAPQTSPGRPSIWRTAAPRLSLGKLSNFSVDGIEAQDRVGDEVGDPYLVLVVDEHRVAAALALRQRERLPRPGGRVVARQFAGVPQTHPQHALGVGPDAARTDIRLRRIDHGRVAGRGVDARDVIAGERRVPDLARRRGGDAVRPVSLRRLPRFDRARRRIEAAIDAALPGEPELAALVEGRGVEVCTLEAFRQREQLHVLRLRIETHDRVLPALGNPRGAVRSDDHAVRRRALAERDLLRFAGLRIEHAERALMLRRVPDRAVGRGRDVMRMRAGRHREILNLRVGECG